MGEARRRPRLGLIDGRLAYLANDEADLYGCQLRNRPGKRLRFYWKHGKAFLPRRGRHLKDRRVRTIYFCEGQSDAIALVDAGLEDLEPATADAQDDRVVLTFAKKNSREIGSASVRDLHNEHFQPGVGLEWDTYWQGGTSGDNRRKVTVEDLAGLFKDGERTSKKKEAEEFLEDQTRLGRTF